MTTLEWDKVGTRRYETGVDRGVLFPPGGPAVPWNGLTSVAETISREVKSYYLDGVKYLDHHVPGSYAAKLSAFTYPDELDSLLGTREFSPGVFLHDQSIKLFNLSYRTRVGNDLEGVDYGYKIHVVYNVMASPNDRTYDTIGESLEPAPFEWDLTGTPPLMFGVRPTAHISLVSRRLAPETLIMVESLLYGDATNDPSLPELVDLLGLLE